MERHNGRKPNTEKSRMIEKCILDKDSQVEIEPEDFSEEADSTILVCVCDRERERESKRDEVRGLSKKSKDKLWDSQVTP